MKKLNVKREIYADETVLKTMKIYRKYAVTTVKFQKDQAIITFWKCKNDECLTVKEFENYMIGIENS